MSPVTQADLENCPTLRNIRKVDAQETEPDTVPSMRMDVEFVYKAAREVTGDAAVAAKVARLFLRLTKG